MRIFVCCVCLFLLNCCDILRDDVQRKTSFNPDWKFYPGDPAGAMDVSFNDSGWQYSALPYNWSHTGEVSDKNLSGTENLHQGVCWYRKYYELPEKFINKTVYLMFDRAYRKREVWVNGQYVGGRRGGDSGYYYNITDYVKLGKSNLIAVRLDNSDEADSKWFTQNLNNRNVWLITPGKTHIIPWGYFVSTPDIGPGYAKIKVQIELQNFREENVVISLINQVRDKSGRKIAESSREVVINLKTETIVTDIIDLRNPEFWNTEYPYKYSLISTLKEDNKIIDRYTTDFAIRNINPEIGFKNSGKGNYHYH